MPGENRLAARDFDVLADDPAPHIYSVRDVAAAAGVSRARVVEAIARGRLRTLDGELFDRDQAIAAVRQLGAAALATSRPELFEDARPAARSTGVSLAISGSMHAALVGALIVAASMGVDTTETIVADAVRPAPVRLVFLAEPGPGGGGGGGGRRQQAPPPKAERKGPAPVSSPLPPRDPVPVAPPPEEVEPPPLEHEPLPPIIAPVASVPGDDRDRAGVLEETAAQAESRGPGVGGGVGAGTGTGLGEGDGTGIGPGEGGGTGGGPYRPGSGIEPPRLLREVKANYTEEARRQGLEGEVVLEIVVRHDGSVGDARVLESLGGGLDQRAVAAVRQWRFAPARRMGNPVDVLVEVAVEFRLR